MKRHLSRSRTFAGAVLAMVLSSMVGCSTVPVTGRQQLNLIPASQMLSMSNQQYNDFLKQNRLSSDAQAGAMVERTGRRIASAVEQYMRQHDMSDQLSGYNWEFHLVENKEANAWCMPGGKVVVYTGLLPITQTENGLAVVLGHEIAHAVAQHGSERMSQGLLAQLGGMALSEALSKKPQATQQLWMTAFGVGAQYGAILPFSRLQENEADRLGLIFMAMAGYDPHEAVNLWTRMTQMQKGGAPPEFMSDHPSDASRIKRIQEEMPEAMQYYAAR